MAAQLLSHRYPLPRLGDAIQCLDSFLNLVSPSSGLAPCALEESDPGQQRPRSLMVSACYQCGSVGVLSGSSNLTPSCYWCQGLWFLGLAAVDATSSAQPRPLPALPSFLSHLARFPLPVVAGVALRLRLWRADVHGLVVEKGPRVLVSPPLGL